MSFRTAYGNEWSENGWRMCNRDECELIEPPPGTNPRFLSALIIRKGPAAVIARAAAIYYHTRVEPLDRYQQGVGDDWGWSSTNDVPNSNHLSGTGWDYNATQYPWGRRTMPAERVEKCEQMARDFEGFLFWGRWWSRVDEMHWQIGVPEFDPDGQPNRRLAAFAQKLLDGHLGLLKPAGPPDPDQFPMPNGYAWGPLENPNGWVISGRYKTDRPEWATGLKRWQKAVGIPESGVYDDATRRVGEALQVANGWPISGLIFEGEWNVVIRHGQRPDLSAEPVGMEYADVSQWQAPVRTGYPHPFFMFRVNNGNDIDRNADENLGWSVSMVNDDKEPLRGFGVYTFWRPGEDNFGALKRAVGVPHPRMLVMIDVESAEGSTKGTVRGDQSDGVNEFIRQVQEWIGDPARVHMGYLNAKINSGLWTRRPTTIRYVIPDYSAPKGKPRTVVDGWRIHQFTQSGRCAPWGDAPIDLNYYGGTASQFFTEFGLDKAIVRPPANPPEQVGDHSMRTAFPLPDTAHFYGPLDGPAQSISGQWRDDRPEWIEGLKKYQRKIGVEATGVWTKGSPTDLATRKVQQDRGWPVSGYVYLGEWDAVMNGDHPPKRAEEPKPSPQPSTGGNKVTTKVKDLTGPGTSAQQWGVCGTDLGIARRVGVTAQNPFGFNLYTFGDSFDGCGVGGPGWRSPLALRSPAYDLAGINAGVNFDSAVGGNYAKQLLPYTHNVGFSTVLPTDLWIVGSRLFMHVMVIGFNGLGDVLWTEIQYSDDWGNTWTHGGPGGRREGGDFDAMFQMLTVESDPGTGWNYAYSSRGLARNSGVYLWRFRDADSLNKAAWEGWGWNGSNWGWGRYPSNIMPAGVTVGEMNLRKVQNNWVFTYFETNSGRIVSKVLGAPNGNIGAAATKVVVTNGPEWLQSINPGNVVAQPYGGYLIPGSTLAEPHYIISQWDTVQGDNWPYRAMQFKGSALTPVNPI